MKARVKDLYPAITGRLKLEFVGRDGAALFTVEEPNLVVDTGRAMMAEEMGARVNQVAVGTDGSASVPSSEAPLTDQFAKALADVTYPDDRTVEYSFVIGADDANELGVIREFGLVYFDDPDYTLFARRAFETGFEKTDQVQINGTWTITF
jgi:hypothetical protein